MSTVMTGTQSLVLASGSASRRELLAKAGIDFEVSPARIDERQIEADLYRRGLRPVDIARGLARAKAIEVAARFSGRTVIAADQVLDAAGHPGTKAIDVLQALEQLRALSGRAHALYSAVCGHAHDRIVFESVHSARLTMRILTEDFLARYAALAGADLLDCVGGYAYERLGIHLFEHADGEHAVILGLPLLSLLAHLRRSGIISS